MNPFISVIVPVFNVQPFLEKCLDSLINQTLQQIEIIIVNDGSTDGSRAIAANYADKDRRIVLIDQSNQGLSAARNTGLEASAGQYVAFVDSDDWVEREAFALMYSEAIRSNADICACDYALAYEDRIEKEVLKLDGQSLVIHDYGLDRLWNSKRYAVMVWNKIYRRDLIETNRLRFESNRNVFSEDVLFNLCFLRHAKILASVQDTLYYYVQRPNSLTGARKPNYMKRELYLVDRFAEWYADYGDRNAYQRILARLFFERVQNSCVHDVEYKVAVSETARDLRHVAEYSGFRAHMDAVAADSDTWRPMRMFAWLCARNQYVSAVLLLHGLSKASRTLHFFKKSKDSESIRPPRLRFLNIKTESGEGRWPVSIKKDETP